MTESDKKQLLKRFEEWLQDPNFRHELARAVYPDGEEDGFEKQRVSKTLYCIITTQGPVDPEIMHDIRKALIRG